LLVVFASIFHRVYIDTIKVGGIFNNHVITYLSQRAGEKISKIGQYSANMWTKVCGVQQVHDKSK